jgi:hypothetical protein
MKAIGFVFYELVFLEMKKITIVHNKVPDIGIWLLFKTQSSGIGIGDSAHHVTYNLSDSYSRVDRGLQTCKVSSSPRHNSCYVRHF